MEWMKLLSTEKLVLDMPEEKQLLYYPINEFEKDYRKIIYSSAFRRLQDKTQVFPLEKSDFVRTRLTHSIEVSAIAKQLGIMAVNNLVELRKKKITPEQADNIVSILQCAGLLHDLGNPPFGHFGEATIGDWFHENLSKLHYGNTKLSDFLTMQMRKDLENFEGNAQALRILLKSKYNSDINISAAIISTLVKYPVTSSMFNAEDEDNKKHKLGIFKAEEDMYRKLADTVGLSETSGTINRHPLTYLLEAADDIAYRTSDLQDAYKKNLFTLDEFLAFFQQECEKEKKKGNKAETYARKMIVDLENRRGAKHSVESDSKVFKEWLNYTRKWLMYSAAYCFSKNYESIMEGKFQKDLFYNTNHSLTIEIFKRTMQKYVFNTQSILKLELSAQTILSFLLEGFVHAAIYYDCAMQDAQHKMTKADSKYIELLSPNYKDDYKSAKMGDPQFDLYLRLLMVTDYISGMTDTYARTLYRELSGIE